MKKYQKYGVLCLFLLCSVWLFAGCKSTPPKVEEKAKEKMPISLAMWHGAEQMMGDPFLTFVEDKFGIEFVPAVISYDNYKQWFSQMAAEDNLPDIIANDILGTSQYESWIATEKIRPLPKDLTQYKNLQAYLDLPYNTRFKRDNGTFYAVPRLTYSKEEMWALDRCIMVRKDYLEKLGIKAPDTFEAFKAYLHQVTTSDLDGNGKIDTEGLTASHLNTFEAVYLSLFPELSNTERGWIYEDNEWMPAYCSKKTAGALEEVRLMYQQGLIDKNFAYTSTQSAVKDFIEGKTGALCAQYYMVLDMLAEENMLDKAQDMVLVLPSFQAEDGNRYRFTTSLHWSESYFSSNVTDEKMHVILSLYDWLASKEFETLCHNGLENIDFVYEKGEIKRLTTASPLRLYPSLDIFNSLLEWHNDEQYTLTEFNKITYGEQNVLYVNQMLQWFKENTNRVNYNYDIIFMSTPQKNALLSNGDVQKRMLKVIVSDESALVTWPQEIEKMKRESSLSYAIKEVTREAFLLKIHP